MKPPQQPEGQEGRETVPPSPVVLHPTPEAVEALARLLAHLARVRAKEKK